MNKALAGVSEESKVDVTNLIHDVMGTGLTIQQAQKLDCDPLAGFENIVITNANMLKVINSLYVL